MLLGILGAALTLAGPLLLTTLPSYVRSFYWSGGRPTLAADLGETLNPNVLAGVLGPLAPLALALAIGPWLAQPFWARPGWLVLALGMTAVVLFTESRGALLAVMAACWLVVAMRWPRTLWWLLPLSLLAAILA